jgi:tetraacyldisaccharide 4'-kinase
MWAGATKVASHAPTRRDPARVDGLRVISVGNLAVGGTGKTPLAAWVAGTLRGAGLPTCVLVGGHGADEAALHRSWNRDVAVLAGRERVASARRARADGARVAVLDDGFQHRALARDLDIVLLSADDPDPAPLLPRGPFRESKSALARADLVVITRRTAGVERARALAASAADACAGGVVASARLEPGAWTSLAGGRQAGPPAEDVLVVCGVARPDAFLRAVASRVVGGAEPMVFPDHHAYGAADVARMVARARGRPIVVTEKDAVKLAPLLDGAAAGARALVLADRLAWDWGEDALRSRIHAAAAPEAV